MALPFSSVNPMMDCKFQCVESLTSNQVSPPVFANDTCTQSERKKVTLFMQMVEDTNQTRAPKEIIDVVRRCFPYDTPLDLPLPSAMEFDCLVNEDLWVTSWHKKGGGAVSIIITTWHWMSFRMTSVKVGFVNSTLNF